MAIEDPLAITRHNIDHARAEERWVTVGEADSKAAANGIHRT